MATSSASSASSRSSYDSERVSATVGETQALWFEVNSIPLIIDAPLEVVWRVVDEICEHPDSSPFNRAEEIEPWTPKPRRRSFIGQFRGRESPLKERPVTSSVDVIDTADEHKREVRFNHRPRSKAGDLCNAKTIHLATRAEPETIKVDKGKEKATSLDEDEGEVQRIKSVRFAVEESMRGKPQERTRYQVTEVFFHDSAIGYRQDVSPGLMEKKARNLATKVKKLAEEHAKTRSAVSGSKL